MAVDVLNEFNNGNNPVDTTIAILDTIDELTPPKRRPIAASGPDRRRALNVSAFAGGVSDKVVHSANGGSAGA